MTESDTSLGEWQVWRQDDHGHRALVAGKLPRDVAEQMVTEFEAKGHKQHYWLEKAPCRDHA
jgi:hypothetical protein